MNPILFIDFLVISLILLSFCCHFVVILLSFCCHFVVILLSFFNEKFVMFFVYIVLYVSVCIVVAAVFVVVCCMLYVVSCCMLYVGQSHRRGSGHFRAVGTFEQWALSSSGHRRAVGTVGQ